IPDLVVANFNDLVLTGTVSVLLGNGDGTFQTAQNYNVGAFPTSVVVGDFNGDGNLDFAVAGGLGGRGVLLGPGDGTFRPDPNFAGSGTTCLVVADFNGDGIPDLAGGDGQSEPLGDLGSMVNVFLGQGGGTFLAAQSYAAGHDPIAVAVGDFNGDGYPDLA